LRRRQGVFRLYQSGLSTARMLHLQLATSCEYFQGNWKSFISEGPSFGGSVLYLLRPKIVTSVEEGHEDVVLKENHFVSECFRGRDEGRDFFFDFRLRCRSGSVCASVGFAIFQNSQFEATVLLPVEVRSSPLKTDVCIQSQQNKVWNTSVDDKISSHGFQ